ncbi:MAG: protein-export chaperone SecB [Lachnospiraceae bacterium]|nr:protein-export chaperone SecB [Lachnospiraceae bacterium]
MGNSVLKLDKLVFDKIEFQRHGFSKEYELEITMEANVSQKEDQDVYKVVLILKGEKREEYSLEISLVGFFSFDSDIDIDEKTKKILVSKNTISIMMPYIRSEVSLLTAQPGVESVVLPPMNINKMMEDQSE